MSEEWPHTDDFGDTVRYVAEHPGLTTVQIAKGTGIRVERIRRYVNDTHYFRKETIHSRIVRGREIRNPISLIFTIENSGNVADVRKDKE